MATGLPDYYKGMDVTYQTLSELINRPKYGAAQSVNASVVATANDKKTIVTVSGKGMIYGGTLGIIATNFIWNDAPILSIDGVEIAGANFYTINDFRMYHENSFPFYMLRYEDVLYRYAVGVSSGMTFETGFAVVYEETAGRTPYLACLVIYALI